jgi:hypothetical protein
LRLLSQQLFQDFSAPLSVEGAEYEVLPALFSLSRFPRWISMEIHHFNERGQEILRLLDSHQYKVIGGDDMSVPCTVITAIKV